MTNPFADTLHLRVQPSAMHQALIVLLYGSALIVATALAIYRPFFYPVLPCVVIAAWGAWCRARLQTGRAIVRLRCGADGVWHWQQQSGAWWEGHLASALCLGDRCVSLGLRPNGRRYRVSPCLLFRDALAETTHRHLRARLTITRTGRPASDDAG